MRLVGSWGVAHDKFKGGLGGGRIRPGIMHVLGKQKPLVPSGLAMMLRFASFLTFLPADHDTLDDYGTALTHGILPGIPF